MPEGDTIFRTAAALRRWLSGREVTAARGAGLDRVVGSTVTGVDTRGKHLLVRFSSGHVLHTHMRMTGAWHVYPEGARWRKPAARARAVIECGERMAVCFDAPVVELLRQHQERVVPELRRLGPDVLAPGFDLDEVVRRARGVAQSTALGEVLLDQRVASGFGNIYRCEALFARRLDPWTPVGAVDDDELRALFEAARRMITVGARAVRARRAVHGRNGRLCRRCGTPITARRLGEQARIVYWCPVCQVRPDCS